MAHTIDYPMDREAAAPKSADAWREALDTPWAKGLAALLAVQLVAALALSLGGRGSMAPTALDSPLFELDPKSVTAIRIEGGAEGPVTLAKSDTGWTLADLGGFPADGAKVDGLVDKIHGLKRPLPVATSAEAQKRHKVGDAGFERKVTLSAGDKPVASLILGDSPGFRRTFARPEGEGSVYDLDLPVFDVSNRRDDWIARDLLRVQKESVERIAAQDWALVKGQDGWQIQGSEAAPDKGAVEDLLGRLSAIGYRGVLGSEDRPDYNQSSPILELKIGLAGGAERVWRISQAKDSKDYVLKDAAKPWYLKLSEYDLDGIKDLTRAKLAGERLAAPAATPVEAPVAAPAPAPAAAVPAADGPQAQLPVAPTETQAPAQTVPAVETPAVAAPAQAPAAPPAPEPSAAPTAAPEPVPTSAPAEPATPATPPQAQ